MMSRLMRWGATALLVLVLPLAVPATSALAAQDVDCTGIDAYVLALQDVGAQMDAVFSGSDDDDLENWTSDDFIAASEMLATVQESLTAIDPPPAAETFHDLLLTQIETLSQMFDTMSTTGIFGALIYAEQMEDLTTRADAAAAEIEAACGVDLTEEMEQVVSDATPVPADDDDIEPVAGAEPGTRANPVPIGETVQIGDEWELTVLSVEPDATETILAANSSAEPPAAGQQYFVATVRVTYTGETSEEFYGWNLRTVGQSAVAYDQFDNSCGWTIPNALPSTELFTGGTIEGNLCWSIDSADADSLVLYDGDQRGNDRIFLSLMPNEPAATPVPVLGTPNSVSDQKSS